MAKCGGVDDPAATPFEEEDEEEEDDDDDDNDEVGLNRWMLTTLGLSVGLTVLLLGLLACWIVPNSNHLKSIGILARGKFEFYLRRR